MLRKLLKYDFRSSFSIMGIFYLVMAGAFLLGLLFKQLKVQQLLGGMAAVLMIAGISVIFAALAIAVVRFHKNLYGAEGYLMQTLPVGKGSLILSKAITAYALLLVGGAGTILAIAGFLYLIEGESLMELVKLLFGDLFLPVLVYVIVMALVQMAAVIGEIFAAVTLANTRPFIKNNILFAVVFFFPGNMLVSLLEMAGLFFIPLGLRFSEQGAALTFETTLSSLMEAGMGTNGMEAITAVSFGMGSILVDAAVAVGFLFLAKWIMTRKASVK